MVCQVECHPWRVFVDDASSSAIFSAGIVIITLEGVWLKHSFRLGFRASNNEAEYEALLIEMRTVLDLGT